MIVSTTVPGVPVGSESWPLPSIGTTEYVARAAKDSGATSLFVINGNAEEGPHTESTVKKSESETGISRLKCILVNTSRDLLEMAEELRGCEMTRLRNFTPSNLTKVRDLQEKEEEEGKA